METFEVEDVNQTTPKFFSCVKFGLYVEYVRFATEL